MLQADTDRRGEILAAAADVFSTSGIRASVKDIADACGILPGSLYHHFESKYAMAAELVANYHADLQAVAADVSVVAEGGPVDVPAIVDYGAAIADCATRHRGAVLLTISDPPEEAGGEMASIDGTTPPVVEQVMTALLVAARDTGVIRRGPDVESLACWMAQSMQHVAVGVFHKDPAASRIPTLKCRMLLEGVMNVELGAASFDANPARVAADDAIALWPSATVAADNRTGRILAAAAHEFGRRGFDATTIRDVAAAAGTNPRNLYRIVSSKEELLGAVLAPFVEHTTAGWSAVGDSDATALQRLEALIWFNVNALGRFRNEHRIQRLALQHTPPESADPAAFFAGQLEVIDKLLSEATAAGEIRVLDDTVTASASARALFSLLWVPDGIVADIGPAATQQLVRDTLLTGVTHHG